MVRRAGSTARELEQQETIVTEEDFGKLKIKTTKRRYVTIYWKEIINLIENRGFRRRVSSLLKQALETFKDGQ